MQVKSFFLILVILCLGTAKESQSKQRRAHHKTALTLGSTLATEIAPGFNNKKGMIGFRGDFIILVGKRHHKTTHSAFIGFGSKINNVMWQKYNYWSRSFSLGHSAEFYTCKCHLRLNSILLFETYFPQYEKISAASLCLQVGFIFPLSRIVAIEVSIGYKLNISRSYKKYELADKEFEIDRRLSGIFAACGIFFRIK